MANFDLLKTITDYFSSQPETYGDPTSQPAGVSPVQPVVTSPPVNAPGVGAKKRTTVAASPPVPVQQVVPYSSTLRAGVPQDDFDAIMARTSPALDEQKRGIAEIQELLGTGPKKSNEINVSPFLAISDFLNKTQFLKGYATPAQQNDAYKKEYQAGLMGLQRERGSLSDKQTDFAKAQFQDIFGRDKLQQMMAIQQAQLAAKQQMDADKQAKDQAMSNTRLDSAEEIVKAKMANDLLKAKSKGSGAKMLPGQIQMDKDFAKLSIAWNQKGDRAAFLKNMGSLDKVISELEADPSLTGSVTSGVWNPLNPYVNRKSASLEQLAKASILDSVKQLGTNPSTIDLIEMQKSIWDRSLGGKENVEKLRAKRLELQRKADALDASSRYFEKTKGTLSGMGAANSKELSIYQQLGPKTPEEQAIFDAWKKSKKVGN